MKNRLLGKAVIDYSVVNDTALSLVERAGRSLFGKKWVKPMADYCGVTVQTVYAWRKGNVNFPRLQAIELAKLAENRMEENKRLAEILAGYGINL